MHHNHNDFSPVWVRTSVELEQIIRDSIQNREISYYLFLNEWDTPCKYFKRKLEEAEKLGGTHNVNVINTFDIPNGLALLRASIQELKETISTSAIRNYTGLPMLVVLHKAFPRVVAYSGSISAELGL